MRDPRARLRGMAGRLVLVSGGRLLVYGGRLETPPWHTEPQAEARPQGPSAAIVQFSLSQALGARPKKNVIFEPWCLRRRIRKAVLVVAESIFLLLAIQGCQFHSVSFR